MERIPAALQSKVMTAEQAAHLIKTGMTIGVSGFTSVGYPKAVPLALAASGHAKDLTLLAGASIGDEIDGALARAGLVSHRFAYQSNRDMRAAINRGEVQYADYHISHFPMNIGQGTGPHIHAAIIECTAVTEDGLIPTASAGSSDALVRAADVVIAEVNTTVPMGIAGMHDIFEVGKPPAAKIVPIMHPMDRVGTAYIPCPEEKIAAIVFSELTDEPQKFRPVTPETEAIGEHVVEFLKGEIAAGRLPADPGPIQSGVGSIGNAVLASLAKSGFRGLSMYTEVMQDAAFPLLEEGVFDHISASSVTLGEDNKIKFYDNIERFHEKIVIRPQEISNHPEVIRRLGVIALNTPIEVDLYGNVNSTHTMGTKIMNGIGGSGDFARNAAVSIFAATSTAKDGAVSRIVPMVSHVDHTEHDVDVIITEQGVADLRWKTPKERARLLIENCAHPDYRAQLREYFKHALAVSPGAHTPHDLAEVFSWHLRYEKTGSMKQTNNPPEKGISVQQMRDADRRTIEGGVPSIELMRRAAQGVYDAYGGWQGGRTLVVCGSGNNGGDGYALAAIMRDAGCDVTVLRVTDKFSVDGQYYYDQCVKKGVPCLLYGAEPVDFGAYSILVDCMLGTGFQGVPKAPVASVIREINRTRGERGAYVIAVDINSGMNGDTGEGQLAVVSDLTVSIGYYKTGMFRGRAGELIKDMTNVDIGIRL